jgi:hypothetical protein
MICKNLNGSVSHLFHLTTPRKRSGASFVQNVRARPIHDIVREVLARSDAVRSSWYKSPPRGQPFPKRVRAGTASIREQQRELALALLQEGAPHALTSRNALRTNYAAEINNASAGQLAQNF